jgi:membrane-associated phospholipid phosphatase
MAGIVAIVATARDWTPRKVAGLTLAMLGSVTGFATVWNLNYVLAILTKDRILDAGMVRFDAAILSALLGPTSYIGLFPIVRIPWLFNLLEASYFMLFAEILLVSIAFAVRRSPRDLAAWLWVLFGTYGIGLAVFACFPLVGPNTYRPDSFDATYHASLTFQAMNNIAAEYARVLSGRPLSGFGYFVAVPSLHVAVATLAQRSMRATPWLFWTLLPVNLLLVSSTVLLGFHYLIDVPTGLMLGFALGHVLERRTSVPTPLRNARGSGSTRKMPA